MNLSDYLSRIARVRGAKSQFARSINVSKSFLRQMETGKAPIPISVAKRIEIQTSGMVTKAELRPDVWD